MLTCDGDLAVSDSAARSSAPEPDQRRQVARSLVPLVVDVGVPVGSYYLLHAGLGLSLWLSLALSSVVPAVRSVTGLVARRELNVLALLMLFGQRRRHRGQLRHRRPAPDDRQGLGDQQRDRGRDPGLGGRCGGR